MTTTMTWEDVHSRIARDDRHKADHNATRFDVRFEGGKLTFRDRAYRVSDHASGQLHARAKVPAKYGAVVRARNLDLYDQMMNDGLAHVAGNGRHLLRVREDPEPTAARGHGILRAALSGDYAVFNNADFMAILTGIFGDGAWDGRHQIRSFHLSDNGFWLKVLFDDLRAWDPVQTSSELKLGVCLGNSEIGTRNLVLRPFVYRKACTNDLVYRREYALEQRHAHLDHAEMVRRVNWALGKSIEDSDVLLDAFTSSVGQRVPDPLKTLDRIMKKAKFSPATIKLARANYMQEPHRSRWGVVNALTATAQEVGAEDRVSLETFAGDYLMAA